MRRSRPGRLLLGAAALGAAAWSLGPFLWQAVTSLETPAEALAAPPAYWPRHPTLAAYAQIFKARPFAAYMLNSLLVALGTTALCTLLGAAAAYAFSRRGLRGSGAAMAAILVVSVFPPTLLIVALKRLIVDAGLVNSLWSLILAYSALNLPFSIWVLRQFFLEIPRELEEAAELDGFSPWQALWRVVFPLAAPAVATTAILVFIASWNEFLLALSFISRDSARTVPVGIALLSGAAVYEVPWTQISAAVVVTTLPVAAIVLLFQRRIIEGLTAGAVKG